MKKQHMIDVVFVITLFCVFALSTLSVIYIGSEVYKNITNKMQDTFQSTTALNYINEKIRQNQANGQIEIGNIEQQPTLMIKQIYNEQAYITYIYQYEGQLKELFIKADQSISLANGTNILPAHTLSLEMINDHLLNFTVSFEDGNSQTGYISLI